MNSLSYRAYSFLGSCVFVSCLPPFFLYTRLSGRHGKNLKERIGYIPRERIGDISGRPRIWVHAASLGEVTAAAPITKALQTILPTCSLVISTTTEHGRHFAQQTFKQDIPVIYGPIDFVGSVRKAISRVRPDVLVFLETEIWPAWVVEANKMGVKTALVNGRISVRSIDGYLKFRPLFRDVLNHFDAFSMITKEDAGRVMALGGAARKIEVHGNAKYDSLVASADPETEGQVRGILDLEDFQPPVLVAGSTREGEEKMILDAYDEILKRFSETILVIAPRHIGRTGVVASLVSKRGLGYQLWTDLDSKRAKRTEQVIIINTFGALSRIYSVASIVFCGASLVPMGGQNPLEAAIWGKAVFHGPSMEDFQDAMTLLAKSGGSILVSNPKMLADRACWYLRHPDLLADLGKQARQAVMENQQAAQKHARVISRLLR